MKPYLVKGRRALLGVEPGDVLEAAVTQEVESAWLAADRVEIVPRSYIVTSPHPIHGVEPGLTAELALPIGQEAALVSGGHLEPASAQPDPDPSGVSDEEHEAEVKKQAAIEANLDGSSDPAPEKGDTDTKEKK